MVYGYYVFTKASVRGFPTATSPRCRIAAAGTSFSPLPCQAWHGCGVTNTHRVEVEVGADGPASATPSRAAAATPPAGAGHKHYKQLSVPCFSAAADHGDRRRKTPPLLPSRLSFSSWVS
jgi:hypothetical protein